MTAFVQRVRQSLGAMFPGLRPSPSQDPALQRYLRFNEEEWGPPPTSDNGAVFLIPMFRWYPCMPGYAHLANHFARKASAAIKWYNFLPHRMPDIEAIYSSFGASEGLGSGRLQIDGERARKLAADIYSSLKTKWDVMNIVVDGLKIGDLIYDTYLRTKPCPTIDLKDQKLVDIIQDSVRITLACRAYFAENKIVGLLTDHFVYISSGLITRCALAAGVPVYQIVYGANFYAFAVSAAPGSKSLPVAGAYPYYSRIFDRFSPTEKDTARAKGRHVLQRRLAGHADGVLTIRGATDGEAVVKSAYAVTSAAPVLEETGRPRIVVLLHDFCDGVHLHRDMLFPDFYEWIHYLLQHASETEFDWYVKPHPNSAREGVLAKVNGAMVQELKNRYPRIRFLEPTSSSRQIIHEGVSAMFTIYGTAAHEFAYLGVPVVNAGDNPHICYDFNIHARTVEEYRGYITHADSLKVKIRKEDIEEYVYMNYVYAEEMLTSDINPISAEFFASEEHKQYQSRPETLELLRHRLSPEEKRELALYFDRLPHLSEPISVNVRDGKPRHPQAEILSS